MNTERIRTESKSTQTHEQQEGTTVPVVIADEKRLASAVHPTGDSSRFEQPRLVTPEGTDIEWNNSAEKSPKREIPVFISVLGERNIMVWEKGERRRQNREAKRIAQAKWRKNHPEKATAQIKKDSQNWRDRQKAKTHSQDGQEPQRNGSN